MVELWGDFSISLALAHDKSAFRKPKFSELHNSILCTLGFIHCRIGIFKKNVSRFSIFGVYDNTDTDGYGKPFH